jgi:hypothetical protein
MPDSLFSLSIVQLNRLEGFLPAKRTSLTSISNLGPGDSRMRPVVFSSRDEDFMFEALVVVSG